jgi:hypothetical protein
MSVALKWRSKTHCYFCENAALIQHVIDELRVGELRVPWRQKVLPGNAQFPGLSYSPSDSSVQPDIAGDSRGQPAGIAGGLIPLEAAPQIHE